MKKFLVFLALLCLVGLALSGCTARSHNIDRFEWWTRYYETRMGLRRTEIKFASPPDFRCEQVLWEQWIGPSGPENVLVTYYNPEASLCRPPWDLALHAACHRRMQHHFLTREFVEAAGIDIEAEAKECETWYRSNAYSGSETRESRLASRTARTRR